MSQSKHTVAQMIGAVKQMEAGRTAEEIGSEIGVSKHAVFAGNCGRGERYGSNRHGIGDQPRE